MLVLLTGWCIYIGSLCVVGLLAKRLNAPKTALIAPVMLLFAGYYAHGAGFLMYAMSHNVTNLFGLVMLVTIVNWLRSQKIYWLVALFFLGIMGGVSDPWLMPAYLYPLVIASFIAGCLNNKLFSRKKAWLLCGISILAVVTIQTKLFHLLHFLPTFKFKIAHSDTNAYAFQAKND